MLVIRCGRRYEVTRTAAGVMDRFNPALIDTLSSACYHTVVFQAGSHRLSRSGLSKRAANERATDVLVERARLTGCDAEGATDDRT